MNSERMRNIIAHGWIAMLFLLMTMTVVWILQGAMEGNLQAYAQEEGISGLWNWAIFFSIAAVMPFFVRIWQGKAFRWIVFGITSLWTIVFIGSWVIEGVAAATAYLILINVVHHIVAVWTTVIAYKWARIEE